ncbi:MAG: glycerophosphodiester phosphodiesterase family protein [Clostridia bacterium]|nr:glycerophosphodiester phosphodiesterase family protein [Clostridia bacterium]
MDIDKYRFVAHRGIHQNDANNVENSIPAFRAAVEKNIGIELDVHLTKDHYLVVVHDHNLEKITGVNKIVEELSLKEIKELKLLGTNNQIPTFEEVLKVVDGKVPIIIEIKNRGTVGALESKLFEVLKKYDGEYAIESFNPLSLLWFKKHDKSMIRGQLSAKKIDTISPFLNFFLSKMLFNVFVKPDFIAYKIEDITEKMYNKYHKNGIYLIGWTLTSKDEYDRYNKLCDGMIFDHYEKLMGIINAKENIYDNEKN